MSGYWDSRVPSVTENLLRQQEMDRDVQRIGASWQPQYNQLMNQYNDLVNQYNQVLAERNNKQAYIQQLKKHAGSVKDLHDWHKAAYMAVKNFPYYATRDTQERDEDIEPYLDIVRNENSEGDAKGKEKYNHLLQRLSEQSDIASDALLSEFFKNEKRFLAYPEEHYVIQVDANTTRPKIPDDYLAGRQRMMRKTNNNMPFPDKEERRQTVLTTMQQMAALTDNVWRVRFERIFLWRLLLAAENLRDAKSQTNPAYTNAERMLQELLQLSPWNTFPADYQDYLTKNLHHRSSPDNLTMLEYANRYLEQQKQANPDSQQALAELDRLREENRHLRTQFMSGKGIVDESIPAPKTDLHESVDERYYRLNAEKHDRALRIAARRRTSGPGFGPG
ncbi:hypothetical protein [Acidithiobacillus thiooxidans]|uniref:hypothetical protein n=1 Tax=Acidithiobacillus thiooxidans TaxID=930 RepID=UPI00356A5428|nr:hypothetical protein [Acidithiobacillus sp.]